MSSFYGQNSVWGNINGDITDQTDLPLIYNLKDGSADGSLRAVGSAAESSTYTIGQYSMALGAYSMVTGRYSLVEGNANNVQGNYSHCEGQGNEIRGHTSHVEGEGNICQRSCQHIEGQFALIDASTETTALDRGEYIHIAGNGTNKNNRSNAYTLDWSGNGVYAGKLTVGADPVNNMDVVTKSYLESYIATLNGNGVNY